MGAEHHPNTDSVSAHHHSFHITDWSLISEHSPDDVSLFLCIKYMYLQAKINIILLTKRYGLIVNRYFMNLFCK